MTDPAYNPSYILRGDGFWQALDQLVSEHEMVIDRPKGSRHPRYPQVIYPLDYGYFDGTTTIDGGGLDVFCGSIAASQLTGVVLTVDLIKRDVEVKLLLGCTADDQHIILDFLNEGRMRAMFIPRPDPPDQGHSSG